jgi:peptidoglycan/LPS O-acetylase OafA/YrhL
MGSGAAIQPSGTVTSTARSIPSLDGLRAASVVIVALSHSPLHLSRWSDRFAGVDLSWIGQSGVDVFFVISGFLITYLLLKESKSRGVILLKNFYFRRFFRIFPPFYAYLAVLGILCIRGVLSQDARDFISAGTYTFNYAPHSSGWLLGHVWSLSLEEQFYLLWPPCLAFLGKKRSIYLAVGVILLSPLSRFLTYVCIPSMRGNEWTMLHTRLDTIMFGCAIALLWESHSFQRTTEKLLHPGLFAASVLYIVIIAPCLTALFGARYDWPVGYTLRGLSISLVLLYVVRKSATPSGRFLNLAPIRHIGITSYSLYLWQQMFTGPHTFAFPLNLLVAIVCAELSYRLIELPAFRVRDWVGARLRLFVGAPGPEREAKTLAVVAEGFAGHNGGPPGD